MFVDWFSLSVQFLRLFSLLVNRDELLKWIRCPVESKVFFLMIPYTVVATFRENRFFFISLWFSLLLCCFFFGLNQQNANKRRESKNEDKSSRLFRFFFLGPLLFILFLSRNVFSYFSRLAFVRCAAVVYGSWPLYPERWRSLDTHTRTSSRLDDISSVIHVFTSAEMRAPSSFATCRRPISDNLPTVHDPYRGC